MYLYPDKNDRLTVELISREFDGAYWGKSEEEILKYAKGEIQKLESKKRMLDLGCGIGRLFKEFAPLTDKIDALEPDYERFQKAEAQSREFEQSVKVFNADISSLQNTKAYDIILTSHIFQHISRDTLYYTLQKA